jgi:transcriptional regulator with XRE-family HTH domain
MDASTGDRIRDIRRRRGWSQRRLADESGVSYSLITQLEQHERESASNVTLHKLADALEVPTSALSAGPDAAPAQATDIEAWEPVRLAVEGRAPGAPEREPVLTAVEGSLGALVADVRANRFDAARTRLPGLLRDCDTLVSLSTNGARSRALLARSRTRQLTALCLSHTWQFGPAATAIDAAIDDAAPDELTLLGAVDEKCWGLMRAGKLAEARELSETWAASAEPRLSTASPGELAAWGRLLLRVASIAVRDNRPGDAEEAMRLARAVATAFGRDSRLRATPWQVFGEATAATIGGEVALLSGFPDEALEETSTVDPATVPVRRHYDRMLLDRGRALAETGQHDDALAVLLEVRQASAPWLAQQRGVWDTLRILINGHKRAIPDQLRELADLTALPL